MKPQIRMKKKNRDGPVMPMLSRNVAPVTAVTAPRFVQEKNLTNCAAKNTRTIYKPSVLIASAIAARDIVAITVNRWPHGYAFSVDTESGDVAWLPTRWPQDRRSWVKARQRLGNIAFAGTDASSNAMTESAIKEAHRAVAELS